MINLISYTSTHFKQSFDIILLFLFISSLQSCTYPFHPEIDLEDINILVVEGCITDEEGPFRIKLNYSFEVDELNLYGEPARNADVTITDDKGNLYNLIYTVNGWYETEDSLLKAIPRNTYTLHIITAEGHQFESTPVFMNEVPEIDSLYYEEINKTAVVDNEVIEEKWLNIMLDTQDPSNYTKYWQWEFEETWEVKTPKDSVLVELKIENEDSPFYELIGKIGVFFFRANVEYQRGNVGEGWDNNKYRCWVEQASNEIIINSTVERADDNIKNFIVKSIPPDNERLDIKYSILVKQMALDEETYKYFYQLQEMNNQNGSIFDKIPEQVIGNIHCCNDDKKALGYFTASQIKKKRIFIDKLDQDMETSDPYGECVYGFGGYYLGHSTGIANPTFAILTGWTLGSGSKWCSDCRYYGTNVMPDYWEEEE